jgi:hypothetical protein
MIFFPILSLFSDTAASLWLAVLRILGASHCCLFIIIFYFAAGVNVGATSQLRHTVSIKVMKYVIQIKILLCGWSSRARSSKASVGAAPAAFTHLWNLLFVVDFFCHCDIASALENSQHGLCSLRYYSVVLGSGRSAHLVSGWIRCTNYCNLSCMAHCSLPARPCISHMCGLTHAVLNSCIFWMEPLS